MYVDRWCRQQDALLSHVDVATVRAQVAVGLGAPAICAAAQEADAEGSYLRAGQLWLALSTVTDEAADRRRAWAAVRRVAPVTAESCELEAGVLQLLLTRRGGIGIGTPEHRDAMARLELLNAQPHCAGFETLRSVFDQSRMLLRFQEYTAAEGAKQVLLPLPSGASAVM